MADLYDNFGKKIDVASSNGSQIITPFRKKNKNVTVRNPLQKMAFGLYPNIYEAPNNGRFRPRYYINQDTELGVNQYGRDWLVRLSREMCSQQPWIYGAIKLLSLFVVGNQYSARYTGDDSAWGKIAMDWINEVFYPNCCSRGPNYPFPVCMDIICKSIDQDGDTLLIFGDGDKESGNVPQFQIIPTHRVRTQGTTPWSPMSNNPSPIDGPYPNTTISDGVVYNSSTGKPVAYSVQSIGNVVNTTSGGTSSNKDGNTSVYISKNNCRLIYEPLYADRGRGLPSISAGILQSVSLQEIETYMNEKLKIQSLLAYVEATPTGEADYDDAENYRKAAFNNPISQLQGFGPDNPINNSSKGLKIVNNPYIRYVSAAGGEIKFPGASITEKETSDYIARLEKGILSTIGVPHALLFSADEISGKMNTSVSNIFNGAIQKRQQLLDFHGKFILGWALAKAIANKELPPNDNEVLTNCFEFTHPEPFSIDDNKERQVDLQEYQAGLKSFNEICKQRNTTPEKVIGEIEKEQIMFFEAANRISKQTGVELTLVLQSMKENLKQKTAPFGGDNND